MPWGMRSAAALLAIAMVVGLGLTSWTSPSAQASIKAGKPCPAVGKQVVKGQWTFTCKVRKGKKVWVKSARPVWERVAEDLLKRVKARSTRVAETTLDVVASPAIPTSTVRRVTESVLWSYQPWEAVAPLPDGYQLVVVNADSREWYLAYSSRYADDNCGQGWWDRTQQLPGISWGAVCTTVDTAGLMSSYLAIYLGSQAKDISDQLALHESVHVARGVMLSEWVFTRSSECWLGEGMAELYTGALTASRRSSALVTEATRVYREGVVRGLHRLQPTGEQSSDPAYWLDVIRRSENRGSELCWGRGLGYSLGYLVTEKLVADFGEESLFTWLAASRDEQDPDGAFADVFGIDQDRWYEESAAPYVAKEASRILAR